MTRIATKPQVAFMHLPKTGGTSVLSALRGSLPADAIATIAYGVAEDPDNLDLAALRDKALLHGHFSARWAGLFDRSTRIAVCLRDPSLAARSLYKYMLAHRPEALSGRQAEIRLHAERGFHGYLEYWRNERSSQYYVHYLDPLFMPPGANDLAPLSGRALEKAVDRALHFLDRCDIVGTSEDLDAFVASILRALDMPADAVAVDRLNVSSELATQSPDSFVALAPDVDQEGDAQTRALLLEITAPSRRIYEHALALAGNRPAAVGERLGVPMGQEGRQPLEFVVCGMPRGGTTFFAQLFNVHQDVFCYFMETGLLRQLSVFGRDRPFPADNLAALEAYLRNEFVAGLVDATNDERTSKFRRLVNYRNILAEYALAEPSGPGVRAWNLDNIDTFVTDVVDLFRRGLHGPELLREGLVLLRAHLSGVTARTVLGEKTPDNLFFVDELQRAVPGLKVFCILREPYSTLESMKRRALRSESYDAAFSTEVWAGIAEYYRSIRAAHDLSRSLDPADFDVYRFEDLLRDPVGEMSRAFGRLGLEPTEAVHEILPRLCAPTDARHARALELSVAERKLIEVTLGPMLRHFGFDVPATVLAAGETPFEEAMLVLDGVHMEGDPVGSPAGKWMSGRADLFLIHGMSRRRLRLVLACNFPEALGLERVTLTVSSGGRELVRVETLASQEEVVVEVDLAAMERTPMNEVMAGGTLRLASSARYAPITIPGLGVDIREYSYLIRSSEYA